MARALKTYQTSAGFHDLAIAAPSMKAALEAWGSRANLFHQGFARETQDKDVVAATMARPGVVLRRPVGTKGAFREESELPKGLPAAKPAARPKAKKTGKAAAAAPEIDEKHTRKAQMSFERERLRRERTRLKQEQDEARADARRERTVEKAEAALEKARSAHARKSEAIERKAQAEDARWARQRATLEAALRRARRT